MISTIVVITLERWYSKIENLIYLEITAQFSPAQIFGKCNYFHSGSRSMEILTQSICLNPAYRKSGTNESNKVFLPKLRQSIHHIGTLFFLLSSKDEHRRY